MRWPRVLIGCPTYKAKEYALEKYLAAIKELDYPNADLVLVDNSDDDSYLKKLQSMGIDTIKVQKDADIRSTVAKCRNVLRKKALDEGYDYFFSFEQDLHSPSPGALHQLLSQNKKVITGIYYKKWNLKDEKTGKIVKEGQSVPVAFAYNEKNPESMQVLEKQTIDKLKSTGGIFKIRMSGFGCCLIHKDVLEKLQFRVEPGKSSWDDAYFFTDLYKMGLDAWADPSVTFEHDEKFDAERKKI